MECGGSDGFSGISANPAVGMVADKLIAGGGSVILSEFLELCGVEQELSDRCESRGLAERFLQLMQNYNQRAQAVGRSEEHTSELQSLMRISYAVFCLKKKKHIKKNRTTNSLCTVYN